MTQSNTNDKARTNRKRQNPARLLTLAAAITAGTVITGALPVGTAHASAASTLKIESKSFLINGTAVKLPAAVIEGETYIGLRSLNEQLKLSTAWDSVKHLVTVTGRNRTLEVSPTKGTYRLNGQQVYASQAYSQNGTTFVPLRFVLERFGYAIGYDAPSKTVRMDAIKENALAIGTEKETYSASKRSILVQYPRVMNFADEAVEDKINAFLAKQAKDHAASGRKELDQAAKDNAAAEKSLPGTKLPPVVYESYYTMSYNEQNRLSFYIDYYMDLGGAHGSTIREAYTFNLTTGDVLTLKAVTNNAKYVELINAQIHKQIKSRQLPLIEEFKTIEADRPFYLSHEGLVINFQQYEYTPYAAGMPEFIIPLSMFK